jgi:hypothetical protein
VPVTVPIVAPNPVTGDRATVYFSVSEPTDKVTLEIVTDSFRKVYKEVYMGNAMNVSSATASNVTHRADGFSIGRNAIKLNIESLRLANGLYFVVVRLPNGEKAIGKLVIIR